MTPRKMKPINPDKIIQVEHLTTNQLVWVRDSYYDGDPEWKTTGVVRTNIDSIEQIENLISQRSPPDDEFKTLGEVEHRLKKTKNNQPRPSQQVGELWFARWTNPNVRDELSVPKSWARELYIDLGGVKTPKPIREGRFARRKCNRVSSNSFQYVVFVPFERPTRDFARALSFNIYERDPFPAPVHGTPDLKSVFKIDLPSGNVRLVHGNDIRLFNLPSEQEYLINETVSQLNMLDSSGKTVKWVTTSPTPMGF